MKSELIIFPLYKPTAEYSLFYPKIWFLQDLKAFHTLKAPNPSHPAETSLKTLEQLQERGHTTAEAPFPCTALRKGAGTTQPKQRTKGESPSPWQRHPLPASPRQGHCCSKLLHLAGSTMGAPAWPQDSRGLLIQWGGPPLLSAPRNLSSRSVSSPYSLVINPGGPGMSQQGTGVS